MVQAEDLRPRHNFAILLDLTCVWRVLTQRQVRSGSVVVTLVGPKQPQCVSLAEDDHVIEQFPSDRADHPLRKRVGPNRRMHPMRTLRTDFSA